MKNITLLADERLLEMARSEAARRGKSAKQLIRDYLQALSGPYEPTQEFQRLRELSGLSQCHRERW